MDELGTFTYTREDDRVMTDRGVVGYVWYRCNKCDEDITYLVIDSDDYDYGVEDFSKYCEDDEGYEDVTEP
jgi:hypothetical protein